MRKTVSYLIVFTLASVGARWVLGHGGTFPPGPSGGGSYTGPGDSTFNPPGGGPPGGGASGGAGPTTPTPGTGDPDDGPGGGNRTGRPPAIPGAGGPGRGPTTGGLGRKNRSRPSADRWERWWALNQDAFLSDVPAHLTQAPRGVTLAAEGQSLPGAALMTGGSRAVIDRHRATAADISERVQPALLRLLREDHPIILDSAAIALGRSVAKSESKDTVTELHRLLRSPYPSVRQSALISLGLLQHRSSVPILWGVMNDTQQGRLTLGRKGSIESTDRGFAALSLGYVGDPTLAPILARQIHNGDVETAAGAVLGLGLLGAHNRHVITQLLDALRDEKVDARVRAQIPIALARLGDNARSATPVLTAALRDTRGNVDVRRSAAIALGRLATSSDTEVVDALKITCSHERDGLLRHFSLLSLGRIGALTVTHTGGPSAESTDSDRARTARNIARYLNGQISDPSRSQDRPWAALAAGVFGRAMHPTHMLRHEFASSIQRWLKRTSNPSEEAAAAIALGLLRDEASGELILDRFRSRRDASTRAHLAIAIALLRDARAQADLEEALIGHRDPGLRVAAATALAEIGDRTAASKLVDMLADAPTFAATAATARALGRIGDRRHLAALVDIVEDDDQLEVVRGFACVALGMIAEKTALPWNAPIAIDANFALPLRAQSELLDIF